MKIQQVRQKTSKSNAKLEAEAQKLIDEARELTDTAKQEISKYR